ncbi:MAG: HAD hydrolase family protein [Magnetococcales bacterium]|nr:HAD hydrolase family protein [Magnetococcales bacterium]
MSIEERILRELARLPASLAEEVLHFTNYLAERHARSLEAASDPAPAPPERVDAVVFDFDGVLTDNRVLVRQDGIESVTCSRGDGMGLGLLRKAGIPVFIMSTETNPVVSARAAKLKLPVMQAVEDKGSALLALCEREGFAPERILFVGNDINDLPAFRVAGYPVAVGDAMPVVKQAAWRVLRSHGGAGVVRELMQDVLGMSDTR